MEKKEVLKARNAICKLAKGWSLLTLCKECPLYSIREPGKSCRDSVLEHRNEAAEILNKNKQI